MGDVSAAVVALLVAVTVPLALCLPTSHDVPRASAGASAWPAPRRRALRAQVAAGMLMALGLALPAGRMAALVATPYLLLCAGHAGRGARRLLARGLRPWAEAAVDTARVYLLGAGLWAWAACAGWSVLGYAPTIVLLTAAHFHAIGFVLLTLGGAIGRRTPTVWAAGLTAGVALGMPLTAIGIWLAPTLERAAGILVIAATLGLMVLAARQRDEMRRGRRALLCGTAALFVWTMVLAGLYLSRRLGWLTCGGRLDPIACMVLAHGALNAAGLSVASVCLLVVAPPAPTDAPAGRPQSDLAGGWRIGASFLQRAGLAAGLPPPRGLVDDLAALCPVELDVQHVAPEIRAFYEATGEQAMRMRAHWRPLARPLHWLWSHFARGIDQLQFTDADDASIDSTLVALRPNVDGRGAARGWVRRHTDGRALYVAVYARHCLHNRPYMNVAMPLPAGNLTSVLALRAIPGDRRGHGLALTTRERGLPSDAGIWWALCCRGLILTLRLPLDERLDVWATGMPGVPPSLAGWLPRGAVTAARHRIALFGRPLITLDYAMWPLTPAC